MEDAIFLANVWKTIREQGWQSIVDFGDVDGIDFVANRVLESGITQRAADGLESADPNLAQSIVIENGDSSPSSARR